MADLQTMFGVEGGESLPPCAPVALTLGGLFQKLGGAFVIDSRGRRGIMTPEYFEPGEMPQLTTDVCDRFHNRAEYAGAMKLVRVMLERLDKQDRDYLFDLFASAAVDPRKADGPSEPRRAS